MTSTDLATLAPAEPMDNIEALASERKALAREVLRLERSVVEFANRVKFTRGAWALRDNLSEATVQLRLARNKLKTFDQDLMGE